MPGYSQILASFFPLIHNCWWEGIGLDEPLIPKPSSCPKFPASSDWVAAPFLGAGVFPEVTTSRSRPFLSLLSQNHRESGSLSLFPCLLAGMFLNWLGKRGPYLFFYVSREQGFKSTHPRTILQVGLPRLGCHARSPALWCLTH